MKKVFLGLSVLFLGFASCENEETLNPEESQSPQEVAVDMSDFSLYSQDDSTAGKTANGFDKCVTMKNLEYRLAINKGLAKKMYDIEYDTRKAIALKNQGKGKPGGTTGGPNGDGIYSGAVTIPVVINILESFTGKVTQAHIDSQIAILNEDFNNNNSNTNGVPSAFAGLVVNSDMNFSVAAINRKVSSKTSWGTRDAMKKSKRGGINPTTPATHLNIWVCEIGGGILGYAQFPGGSADTDGVVIGTDFFGRNTAGGIYGYGRTATHEVGHWLNLRHIWGDGGCSVDDFVVDTPVSGGANYNCPSYPDVSCNSADMTMNYMDYVQDECMYMFTIGQDERMRALFSTGGARAGFVN